MLSKSDIQFDEYNENEKGKNMLFIVNPYAGKGVNRKLIEEIIGIFKAEGWFVTLYLTTARNDATVHVKEVGAKYDRLLCFGGDGTLSEVISGVMALEKSIPIGYIPAGSTNDLGVSIGLPKDHIKAAKIVAKGKVREHDIGSFNGKNFVYIASFGAFTEVSWDTPQDIKKALGHAAYVLYGAKAFFQIKSTHFKIKTDFKEFDGDYIFCAISNTFRTGGTYRFNENEVNLSDGLLEVMLVKKPEKPKEVPSVLRRLLWHKYDDYEVAFVHTNKVDVEFSDTVPVWTLDGEKEEAGEKVHIECVHGKIQLVY